MADPYPGEVRRLVGRTFAEFGVANETLDDLNETILIDDARYVARSYRAGRFMAMWLIDVGILQFYDDVGNMLRTINLLENSRADRLAA